MTDARLSVEVGGKIDELKAVLTQGKASVKDFVGYTDAQLLASGGNYNKYANDVARASREASLARIKAAGDAARAEIASSKEASTASELSFTSIGQSATKGLSALRQIAYVLPGIGVAGIFSLAFEGIMKASEALDIFSTKLSAAAQNRIALNDAISKGNQEAGKEITTLKILYDAATDVANSTDTRTKAAKELQKLFPETFKNTSLEAIEAGKLSGAYQQLTQDIIANARAKSIAAKIGELSAKLLDADIQSAKIENAKLNELSRVTGPKIQARLSGAGQQDVNGSTISVSEKSQKDDINVRAKLANDANDLNRKILNDQIKFLESFTDAKSLVGAVSKKETTQIIEDTGIQDKALENLLLLGERVKVIFQGILTPSRLTGDGATNLYGQKTVELGISALGEKFQHLGTIVKQVTNPQNGERFLSPFQSLLADVLPKLQSGFETFFNDILEKGTLSFKALGQAILKTFESIIASEVTRSLLNLIANAANIGGSNKNGGGIAQNVTGAAASAIPLIAGGTAASGGLLLPILGGIAAIGLISSLFKKHKAPDPVYTSNNPVSSGGNGGGLQTVQVKAVISGRDLVMLLNLEGYYLSRVQQHG